MQATWNQKSFVLFALGTLALPCLSMVYGDDYELSAPLDETLVVREVLTSGESDEVPPEPVPPNEYQPLDTMTPTLIAEEILRLRETLGTSPLTRGPGFRPLTLANESDEHEAAPAPWEHESDRRDFRERLRGIASRPLLPQPHGVPYGVTPYHINPPACITQPSPPQVYLHPQPVQIPYGYEPFAEGCHSPMAAPSFAVAEHQGQKQVDMLRQMAHQLDETAHQLECCEQFERADQVRELATQLRQDARRGQRAQETTVMRSIQPAGNETAESLIRAALRNRAAGSSLNPAADAEPSCPACPTLQRTRPGAYLEDSHQRGE